MPKSLAIDINDVMSARQLLDGVAFETPLLASSDAVGGPVLLKFEGAQRTGSFKFRGAYNRLARIEPADRAAGVVAWSSGNHAQGVAAAAKLLNMPATIVMPADAPGIKIANTRTLGADIVFYDRTQQSREEIARAIVARTGAALVPSFDDPFVIAGQGTIGLEILDQARAARARIGRVLVCCGGGGLVAGVATAIKASAPEVEIYCVEPEGFDDTARSLLSGRRENIAAGAASICDALLAPSPGELTFPINRALLTGGLVVSDRQVRHAMRYAFEELKLVVEPGGAVALAAALNGLLPASPLATVVIISGANVDAAAYARIIAQD